MKVTAENSTGSRSTRPSGRHSTLISDFANSLAAAIKSHAPLPAFTDTLSLDDAYALQHQVTQARTGGQIGGVKAGVTAPMVQAYFKLDHALIGSLYADGRHSTGCSLTYLEGRAIECEVAIIVDEDGRPKSVAPAIEIVFVKFSQQADMTAPNLVACNLGADLYIVGDPVPWDPAFNATKVVLTCGDETVNEADMTDALGGPESAANWMWKEVRARDFPLSGGTLLLAGACGTVVPAKPGHYAADFGALGKIEFEIAGDA